MKQLHLFFMYSGIKKIKKRVLITLKPKILTIILKWNPPIKKFTISRENY